MISFLGKMFIRGELEIVTGLHIGGAKDVMEIGGMDNPVVKTLQGVPYIPASSLKGKLRCLLERKWGVKKSNKEGEPCGCGECPICQLFGSHSPESKTLTRLIIRDAFLNEEHYRSKFRFPFEEDFTYTEEKVENIIDRLEGKAQHPRFIERVSAGACFFLEMMLSFYEGDKIPSLLGCFVEGMRLLEDDYLGGSGSRGYGKVAFRGLRFSAKTKLDYQGENKENLLIQIDKLADISINDLLEKIKSLFPSGVGESQ